MATNPITVKETPQFCQEGNNCDGRTSASLFCVDCGTFQCENCCTLLHIPESQEHHTRLELAETPCRQFCEGKHTATTHCVSCEKAMCVACDRKTHTASREGHHRFSFQRPHGRTDRSGASDGEDAADNLLSSAVGHARGSRSSTSEPLGASIEEESQQYPAVKLINNKEELTVKDAATFVASLQCPPEGKLKVVAIFGNTGDGKSFTLNHAFFEGYDLFSTSSSPQSCTVGVWAAYSNKHKAIFIDTEGLLGATQDENKRTRLLMKVLAISDVVIYRTRAERLHNDMFLFLADASEAYHKYFAEALRSVSERGHLDVSLSALGPAVVVFHETSYTDTLEGLSQGESPAAWNADTGQAEDEAQLLLDATRTPEPTAPEECLRRRFSELGRSPKAFSCFHYVGTRTSQPPTDFSKLQACVSDLLKDTSVRAARLPQIIFTALEVLNHKFSGDISNFSQHTFPDQFFTCGTTCSACSTRCGLSMSHEQDGLRHSAKGVRCKYQAQFDNQVFLCKLCYNDGAETVVLPKTSEAKDGAWFGLMKYAWSGYVLECPQHGIIYRSRQHWYGNKMPEEKAVKTVIKHVWPGELAVCADGTHAAWRVIEGMGSVAGVVGSVTAVPTKAVSSWMADMAAPTYWRPNSEIVACKACKKHFGSVDTKHHCRACGEGFCDECTSHELPVPWRGWNTPRRVCDTCYQKYSKHTSKKVASASADSNSKKDVASSSHPQKVTARYVTEVIQTAAQYVGGAVSYSKDVVVDASKPAYWQRDMEAHKCRHCKIAFSSKVARHHCRACGGVFCEDCSMKRAPVPSQGWDYPVRVCDSCANRPYL